MSTRHGVLPGVLAAAWLAYASPGPALASSLQQGFDAAWARQPEQQAGALRRDAAAARLAASRRWTPEPPALELSARSDRLTRNDGVREVDAALAVPLWLPGERERAGAAAVAEADHVDARLLAGRWRLAAEVREAYWAHRRARLDEQLAEQRLAHARRLADDVARRVRAGDLARADGHQADSAAAAAEAALAEAGLQRTLAASRWTQLTGLADAPSDAGPAEPRPADTPVDDTHPALREPAALADLARRQRELARVQTRAHPELTLGAVRERDGYGERYGQSLVIGVRVPLGTSSDSRARLAAAGAELVEAESQRALAAERLRLDAAAARLALHALETVQASAERRAALALASRGFVEKAFALGEADLPTRLRVELDAYEAERQAVRSRLDVDAAVSHWRQALGLLPTALKDTP